MSYVGYTDEKREQVVADSVQHGVNAAAKTHGISRETVRRWRKERGIAVERRRQVLPP